MNSCDVRMDDFIFPFFVYEDENVLKKSLGTGQMNKSKIHVNNITQLLERVDRLGVSQILLFGIPKKRDINGNSALQKKGVVQRSLKTIRQNFGDKFKIFSDVCLCQYNKSGHCGIAANATTRRGPIISGETRIDNDKTLQKLGEISISHCESGTDFIAPSSMMDGQVIYLRNLLDSEGFGDVNILSYSSKHNSCLYSPFRSSNYLNSRNFDKNSYQISFNNPRESLRETLIDIEEGADWVMIKPSLWYMDIIRYAKESIQVPLVVQNVSGEYALLKALIGGINDTCSNTVTSIALSFVKSEYHHYPLKNPKVKSKEFFDYKNEMVFRESGLLGGDLKDSNSEILMNLMKSYKRAGADKIISYFLLDLISNKL
ncbi:MAG: porphobilinogen synthase [Candidatus Nitrosocosmicus sp.]